MPVTHTKVSGKADGGDATLILPSDWNANHTISNATITKAMMADISATQRLLGRNTAGAGVPEEVTASQLFDWVSATNGVLLTRTAGAWAAAANVTIDGGDLVVAENAAPATPAAAKVKLHGRSAGGRSVPAWVDPDGRIADIQTGLARRSVAWAAPRAGVATLDANGVTMSNTGTVTLRALASTNMATGSRRVGYVSAAGAGSTCGIRASANAWWRGDAAGRGGLHMAWRFMISDAALVATGRTFAGVITGAGAPADVDPSTLVNIIGVGNDNGDANLQLYASDATARARTDLGANFPAQTITTDIYELILWAPPNGSFIKYLLTRLNTGHTASGTISNANNMPVATQMMGAHCFRTNGGTATAVGIDVLGFWLETEL